MSIFTPFQALAGLRAVFKLVDESPQAERELRRLQDALARFWDACDRRGMRKAETAERLCRTMADRLDDELRLLGG